jgi:hypothetical protein
VYQVGQLLGMLVKGDAGARIRTSEIRRLPCGDHLKEIVYRCIGERRKRYESADELIDALRNPPAELRAGAPRTLKGVHLAFTGILTRRRSEAVRAARRAGAVVHGGPSVKTTVVVRGRPNPLQAAGRDAGRKLMEIKRLREKGHRITLLAEAGFWRLVGRKPGPHPVRKPESAGAVLEFEAREQPLAMLHALPGEVAPLGRLLLPLDQVEEGDGRVTVEPVVAREVDLDRAAADRARDGELQH